MRIVEGHGEAIGHHGELIQGVFEDWEGNLHRGLISLPCRHLNSKAEFRPRDEAGVSVTPIHRKKSKLAVELSLETLGRGGTGGHLAIASNIPIGRGMGSSTADVLASILAVFDSLHSPPTPDIVMEIAVRAEMACDSTLFSQVAVLFAQREGKVIEAFRNPLPPIDLISVDTAAGQTIDTLAFKSARYSSSEIELFRPLRSALRKALEASDLDLLGRVATASARINERFLRKPRLHEIEAIGARHGAVGIQVAHSGTVVGLMFDPTKEKSAGNVELARHDLRISGFESSIIPH
ncbi:GHMP kinase [Rhizobium sp. CCGE531]|uniref:GHMP family kinase ATP-binding protein n=1 Tax=Rhizobium sp. CCGE531 TaxID=2364271 RepID=UPI000EAA8EB0|nr:GHMP kinase [Rhizobium sp. CCGE531]AYG66090.1 GHMP kinase [Rhizobium sp. CCGE531]